jgi:hypothetical protein
VFGFGDGIPDFLARGVDPDTAFDGYPLHVLLLFATEWLHIIINEKMFQHKGVKEHLIYG